MKIGYARVSKHEQNVQLQLDALKAAGCERVYTDTISGAKFERKGLDQVLEYVRPGDTFVVWKLDRLGRSLKDLIEIVTDLERQGIEFASITERMDTSTPGGKLIFHMMGALAEYERALIRERTRAGLASARARGRLGGRPAKLNGRQVAQLRTLYGDPERDIKAICEQFGISRATLYQYVRTKETR